MENIRVRFAPSPTGPLHIGGVRTALYNYLFAKKTGGKFILRIEDTDQSRKVEGTEKYINESLQWLGIQPDESPTVGGDFGPYRQSERKDLYAEYAKKLVDEGNAYYAFDTPEELEAMRERLKEAKVATLHYNSITRMQMKNSLTLSTEEVEQRLASGEPYVIRLKVPLKEEVRLNDTVRGWVMVHSSAIDDKVLMKSDGMPTYHLANVVDDHLMKITHVIRGEEWLPSAPLHVLLYRFLGWEDTMPQFAHLPLLLKPDGNGKLSKRDGDKHGFPVFPISSELGGEKINGFREAGYLPETMINFLAFLGWNPGTEQELFSINELVESFSLERIGKSGAKFDIEKANWLNQHYLKNKDVNDLVKYLKKDLDDRGISANDLNLEALCEAMRPRVSFPQDLYNDGKFFFQRPDAYDEKLVNKKWTEEAIAFLDEFSSVLKSEQPDNPVAAKSVLQNLLEEKAVKMGVAMPAIRLALTGSGAGPDLMEIIAILGAEESAERIQEAINKIPIGKD